MLESLSVSALRSYPDRLSFEQDIAQMKEWVAARVKWLDTEIARRADRGA
jgi:hypothetical protein